MTSTITRWTPAGDVFRGHFGRVFDQVLQDAYGNTEETSNRTWLPAVDIREAGDALELAVELPGLGKDDIDITLENRTLTLRGERKFEKNVDKTNYHRIERSYGAFSRSFTLPTDVATDEVQASFDNGVLWITIPKAEEAKPRKITIK